MSAIKSLSLFLSLTIIFLLSTDISKAQSCYQSYIEASPDHEVRLIGIFNKQKLYGEILTFNNGGGTKLNIILLRTDTSTIKDFDICFEMYGGLDINVSTIGSNSETDSSFSLKDIKNISQLLFGQLDYAWLDSKDTKIYLKDNNIFLKYFTGSCISSCPNYIVTEVYKFKNGEFVSIKKTRKKISKVLSHLSI